MQISNFINFLEQPHQVENMLQEEVMSLLTEFPYCQTGQMMLSIQLNNKNTILFEQQLKKAAAYCPDRKKLFEVLEATKQDLLVVEDKEPLVLSKREEKKQEVKAEDIQETSEILQEEKTLKPKIDELDLLEKQYLAVAVSSSISIEADEVKIEKSNKEEIKDKPDFDEETGHTFGDWLKHYNGDEIGGEETLKTSNGASSKSQQDIIDRFIQEDPQIKPKKTKFYSPTNMARLSVVDDSDIVSETLALIYVDQGQYTEAIKTYQKLSLKNPEKSSYFASQIKILNQKIK